MKQKKIKKNRSLLNTCGNLKKFLPLLGGREVLKTDSGLASKGPSCGLK
jgi:hypothetical protein